MILETISAALAFGLLAIGAVGAVLVIGLLAYTTKDKEARSRWLP